MSNKNVVPTPEGETIQNALLQALRAGNPDYNTSLKEASRFREHLAGLGIRIDVIAAIPSVSGALIADLIGEDDLIEAKVDPALPLNLHCRFAGRDDWHNLGLLRKMLRPATPAAFRAVFANVYGTADPSGRTAVDLLLALPAVNEAVQKYLTGK